MEPPVRYMSPDEDSARWSELSLRPGDVVISTRSKSGTTWMQQICLSLALGRAELPDALARLSPWVDWLAEPIEDVSARLAAQAQPRVLKTHTPLDGIPLDPRVTYIVVARHPLDAAVSLYHQGENLNRRRIWQLTGAQPPPWRPRLKEWLLRWIHDDVDPRESLDSLPGVMWHLTDAWSRQGAPNVHLVHYADLLNDLDSEMRRVADILDVPVDEGAWPSLVHAATFSSMRARAAESAPASNGLLKDPSAFFRRGTVGDGEALLTADERARYEDRVGGLGPPELIDWLHR
ncbi:sulfotransferase domain-containing protein [Nocardioides panacisoli]|uniref:sulfotransferase domain-containing protein n=1 Tax=Nocardioides panacisoli TaxID=627624 RepID=UPI001C6270E3|nr:sulfotransferase domain-containing protein [Nocardioides panacisoli]QYJ02606.1 sulfotransferase domain-containing protein [Nocardioides panacisoli]